MYKNVDNYKVDATMLDTLSLKINELIDAFEKLQKRVAQLEEDNNG